MSALGDLETALWKGDYQRLAESHTHRAAREDSLGVIKGRDAILAKWIETAGLAVELSCDLDDMIAVQSTDQDWRLHRWVWREDGRIVREVEVTNRLRSLRPADIHPPLGELRAGIGQYAARAEAILPPGFPEDAKPLADDLHQAWNGRAFAKEPPKEIRTLISELPDATFYFENALVGEDSTAILFRTMGHHASGVRVRLIGSYLARHHSGFELILDLPCYAAQKLAAPIDYGQTGAPR